ncbi:MAG: type II toxin-antitoxin system VapB family antitoxin [Candidatus Electrothrix aestuarii]|jgi:Arc/MetJ family transcription regulator|uniref:Type II toxin-antitoxin system VapB family antitoxin n=1 Tax=Candidatus Electrothrix aestuarii TaxID=3062594 RepID=A0AAU8LU48_9BACT|nr:type II toxin-antitoxin system VapB family antitoxin [Candidatus Electrothrix aestuarii]WPD21108.1 MAG: type II toxin-antitoxin system VapB family antitoxin [Candidatus Electrothrix sp. GW3-3]
MRTNIVVDDSLMEEAMRLSAIKTKKGVIDQALRLLVQVKRQEAVRQLKGRLHWEGDLEKMRLDR